MTFLEGLARGRSHIVFIAALLTAGGIIVRIDQTGQVPSSDPPARAMSCRTAGRTEAATWALAAAAASPRPADREQARRLAMRLGLRPGASSPGASVPSAAAGLAVLEALAADTCPGPVAASPH